MNPNDPAFMVIGTYAEGSNALPTGLTKREYFAAMALNHEVQYGLESVDSEMAKDTFKTIAVNCVRMADALIAELSKGETK